MSNIKIMGAYAIGLVSLAATTLIGAAIVTGFKNSGTIGNCTNSSHALYTSGSCDEADDFIAGLAVFGTFASILAIAVIGKIIIGLFKDE